MHFWQQGSLGNVDRMVREEVIAFVSEIRTIQISPSNLDGCKLSLHHFKVHAKPVNMPHSNPKSIQKSSKNCPKLGARHFFRLPWENLNFSITIKVILKSFEHITANTHPPHTPL